LHFANTSISVDLLKVGEEKVSVYAGKMDGHEHALPERHVIYVLLETGGIKVGAEFLGEKIADVIALRAVAVANAEHGRVLHPGPYNIRVLVLLLSVLRLVSGLEEKGGEYGKEGQKAMFS
jgi:hypothetical protein